MPGSEDPATEIETTLRRQHAKRTRVVLALGLLVRMSGQVSLCLATLAGVGAAVFSQFAAGAGLPWGVALVLTLASAWIDPPSGSLRRRSFSGATADHERVSPSVSWQSPPLAFD